MIKKNYRQPHVLIITFSYESLMVTASPGVDYDGFDPDEPIDAREFYPVLNDMKEDEDQYDE